MQLWLREPTPSDQLHYNFSKKVAEGKIYEVGPYEVMAYNECWRLRKGEIPYELATTCPIAKSCLNAQNPYFTRYAYAREIPPEDLEYALYMRLDDWVNQGLVFANGIITRFGGTWREAVTYLGDSLDIGYNDSLYWLKILIVAFCERYGFVTAGDDPAIMGDPIIAVKAHPLTSIFWGEIPEGFKGLIVKKYKVKGYDLEDKVDEISYDAVAHIDLKGFFEWHRQDLEDRHKRRRFRFTLLAGFVLAVVLAPAVITAFQAAISAALSPSLAVLSTISKIKLGLEVFAGTLKLTISAILTAIHFDTLVSVHKIAWLVSEDYRVIMRGVYAEISKVSEALGYGPYFMALFLQNAKVLVTDVCTTLGMKHDLAQVEWLSVSSEYLRYFSAAAHKYKDNPEALFFDLERWVERPVQDRKAEFMQGLVQTIRHTTEIAESVVEDITMIRDDLYRLIVDLPGNIQDSVGPIITPYIERFDTFITDTYDPFRTRLDDLVDTVISLQAGQREEMSNLVTRLRKPGDYLSEIDNLSTDERFDQERKIGDIAVRQYTRDINDFVQLSKPIDAELAKIREAMKRISLIPLELPVEYEGPQRPAGVKAKERETWYVGDF